ncbi:MAG: histidine kinase, partial [Phototrophicales bacterium]
FYFVEKGEMTVQQYQGPLACQVLAKDQGVCWAAYNQQQSIVVPNVHEFPGHIACDSRSNSEIVVPVFNHQNQIVGVLDVDSQNLNSFTETDRIWLEKIVHLIFV